MKKSFLFWGISLLLIVAPVVNAQLFNASKTYVVKTVVPVVSGSFVVGDTVLWTGNLSNLYGSKADGIYPVINSAYDVTKSQFLWTIEPTGSGPYTYTFRNNAMGYINYYTGAAQSMYLAAGGPVSFTITAITDGNGKTCYNVMGSSNAYLTNVIDARGGSTTGCMNTTVANAVAPFPSIYIYEAPSAAATTLEKAPLLAAIQSATTVYNASVVGSALGQFSAPNKTTFNSAIAAAQAVYDSPTSSILVVNSAIATLKTAVSTFKNSVIVDTNPLADGLYYITVTNGVDTYYLTDISADETTKFKPFMTKGNISLQKFKFTRETNTRYRIQGKNRLDYSNSRNSINESANFGANAYDASWNSMTVSYNGTNYAIQRGGSSGTSYWSPSSYVVDATINSSTTIDNFVFNLIPADNTVNKSYTENFEAAVPNYELTASTPGINFILLPGWTAGGAPYSNSTINLVRSIETTSPISGTKSLIMDLTDVGNDYWAIQIRMTNLISYTIGKKIKLSYKIKSDVASTLQFENSGVGGTWGNVVLAGNNVVETKEFLSPVTNAAAQDFFIWYLGRPTTPCKMVIDDIVIQEFNDTPTAIEKIEALNMSAYFVGKQLNVMTQNDAKVEVLDLIGKTIAAVNAKSNQLISIPVQRNSGCLLVKATDINGNISVRKVIVR